MLDAIKLHNVSKDYPGIRALDGISFAVKQGSVHGFLGPNGAGKSTTMKIITGLLQQTDGQVEVLGLDVSKNHKALRSQMGFLAEGPPLYSNMTTSDFLKFMGKIHGLSGKFLRSSTQSIIEKCGLQQVEKRLIGNLSKGYKQRVGLAQALIHRPKLVLLDEPTAGLDPSAIVEIRKLIVDLRGEHTILLSSHQLHEVGLVCSDITIINQGKITQSGPIDEVQNNFQTKQVIRAYVKNWDEQLSNEIYEVFNCENLEIMEKDNNYELMFCSKSTEDLRSQLSEYLIQKDCGLLSFSEERVNLEDIFQKVTDMECQVT